MTEGVGLGAIMNARTLIISRHRAIPPISPLSNTPVLRVNLVAVVGLLCVVGALSRVTCPKRFPAPNFFS